MSSQKNLLLVSKVGIIGAGVSGIAAARQLAGFEPVVFEATDSIGGVWKHCSFSSTRLQTPRFDYEFSDYPWPPTTEPRSFPTHTEILDYLHAYATNFDVLKYIKFNSKVMEVRYMGESEEKARTSRFELEEYGSLLKGRPVWEVAVKTAHSDAVQWYGFELLVVCIGKYGDIPKLPSYPPNKGPEVFNGKVLHSMEYSRLGKKEAYELLHGKKVAVVGFRKSAIDLAVESAEANQGPDGQPCTMVIRTLHWTVPSYWIWGLPFFLFYSTRSSQYLHERPNQSLLRTFLCLSLSPVRRALSMFIESYLVWKLPLTKYGLKPDHPFVEDYASCQMAILPENFFSEAEKGRILFKRANNWWFWSGGIEFDDKSRLEADVVILATGYDGKKKLESFLPEPFSSLVDDPSGVMPLYRGTIHPLIPNMAFVGYLESFSNLHSAELRCKWLAGLARNQFKLPSMEKMLDQTTKEIEVMKRTTRFYERHCITTFSINHSDGICEEMGWSGWRKKNWLAEAFSPYNCRDYKN
ncbi:Flavin-containing monooxygenase [Bertholletia excelsa]